MNLYGLLVGPWFNINVLVDNEKHGPNNTRVVLHLHIAVIMMDLRVYSITNVSW